MSIKVSDRQALPRKHEPHSQTSLIMKWFVALGLMVIVAMNVASILPVTMPANVATSTPTETASTLTFKAEADAQVEEGSPTTNAGSSEDLEVILEANHSVESYIRFSVSGIPEVIQNARLRVYSTTDTAENGPALYAADNHWAETEITWSSRPTRLAKASDNKDQIRRHSWVEYDVSALITGNGTYSFVLAGDSSEGIRFSSREGINDPQLIVTFASGASKSPPLNTATPPATTAAGAGGPLTFTAAADASVVQGSPAVNHGSSPDLQAGGDSGAAQTSYIRFTVSGINEAIHSVKLRVFATKGTGNGPAVHFAEDNWTESGADGLTWNTQPTLLSGPIDNKETIETASWVDYDVSAAVTGDGSYTFALVADSHELAMFSSREGSAAPELVVTLGLGAPTPTASPSSGGGVVLVGAGDIATCDRDHDELTAELLDHIPGTVFTTGDNAYVDGSYGEYLHCYDPSWGRHKSRTKPSPGNHEYNTAGAAGYFQYFNNVPSYYAYELGSWRVYALNSGIDASASSPQAVWLAEDLAEHARQCVLAYWHKPSWSSGAKHGSDPTMQTLWRLLYDAGAELVVNGHEHHYERFAEMDGSGAAVREGLREIVVGTGGAGLYSFETPLAASEVRDDSTYGVLKLNLRPAGYDWQFIPVPGSTFNDSGSSDCH